MKIELAKTEIIHFVGIGGIGMSGLSLIMKGKGFKVQGSDLSTNKNISKVYKQATYFNVKDVIINDFASFIKAKKKYNKSNIKFHNTFSIIDKIFLKKKIFYAMISIVGLDGLDPSLRIIKYTNNIAIINKESLICGWNIISKSLTKYKCNFYPIDSEHFSIFSLLNGKSQNTIEKVFITASGGPFLNFSNSKLSKITLEQSIKCSKTGAVIGIIGVLSGGIAELPIGRVIYKAVRLIGISCGNKIELINMIEKFNSSNIRPVIDSIFKFSDLPKALNYMNKGTHLGKIAIDFAK